MVSDLPEIYIDDIQHRDIQQIVSIIKETRLGFMSHMPRPFIRFYYRNIPELPHWRCRVIKQGDDVLGFYVVTIGTLVPRYEPLLNSFWMFLFLSVACITPCFILLRYYVMERQIAAHHHELRSKYDCELVYLGIHPNHQNKGLGFRVMCDMRRIFEAAGTTAMGTEFFKDDEQAAQFYAKYGYEKLGEIATGGRMSCSIRYNVDALPVAEP